VSGPRLLAFARREAGAALGLVSLALAACGDDSSSVKLERDPSWLAPCAASSECANGQCVCGVCSETCGATPDDDCSRSPAGAACFARGSIAHASTCGDGDVGGVCLPSCRQGDDCGAGFVCDLGACVPATSMETTAPGSATSRAYAESFPSSWPGAPPPGAGPAQSCDDPAKCPTLEALLRTDSCFEVMRGCGITYLNAHDGDEQNLFYWYDAFGAPPRLRYDLDGGELVGSAEVACDAVEMACWTCEATQLARPMALAVALCADVPQIWPTPEPPPDEQPGCTCEPDGDGTRVSLDCFCGLYPCPSQDELLSDWAESAAASDERPFIGGMLDANAQVWLSFARYSGQRYAFDASGALVGAIAFSQGPSTLPCNTNWVAAGPVREAEPTESCSYQSSLVCSEADWFPALP
jgi:hypothetical protein